MKKKQKEIPTPIPPPTNSQAASTSAKQSGNYKDLYVDVKETGNFIIVPPDGGWGWIVVLSAFLTFTVTDGLSYCFGLFMEDIAKEMMVSVTMVSITSSLLTSEVYMLGPVFCAMINHYGFRLVALIGGIGSTTCVLAASFAPNFPIFIVIMGVIGGVFLSMSYISSCIIVGFYFERWRALATAISVSGSAMGVIVVPLLLGVLQDYTWRLQLRVISTLLVVTIIAALTYKSIAPVLVENVPDLNKKLDILQMVSTNDSRITEYDRSTAMSSVTWRDNMRTNRLNNLMYPTAATIHGTGPIVISNMDPSEFLVTKSNNQSLVSDFNWMGGNDVKTRRRCYLDCSWCHKKLSRQKKTLMFIATRPLYREDIFVQGPLSRLEKYKNAKAAAVESTRPGASMTNYHMDVTHMTAYQDFLDQQSGKCLCCPNAVVRILSTMFDMHLLRSCSFTMFMFSGFFTAAGMYVPYIYVTDMNIAAGLDESSSRSLLSIIGFSNIIGRIMCGLVSISPKLKAIIVMEVSLVISGIAIILMPFFPNIYLQYAFASVFGLTIAVNGALRPVVIVDLFSLEKLTNAFGLAMLFQGVACTIGLPVAGILKDITESYHALMIFAGGCLTLSGLMIFPVKPLATREHNSEYSKKFEYEMLDAAQAAGFNDKSPAPKNRWSLLGNKDDKRDVNRQIV